MSLPTIRGGDSESWMKYRNRGWIHQCPDSIIRDTTSMTLSGCDPSPGFNAKPLKAPPVCFLLQGWGVFVATATRPRQTARRLQVCMLSGAPRRTLFPGSKPSYYMQDVWIQGSRSPFILLWVTWIITVVLVKGANSSQPLPGSQHTVCELSAFSVGK